MVDIREFGQTEHVVITVLVDNRTDLLVKPTHAVKYFTDAPLLAEHGFAALVDLQPAGVRILWDAGLTSHVLPENMRRMKIDPATIGAVALSHGHGDHTGAVAEVLRATCPPPTSRTWPKDASLDDIVAWSRPRRIPLVLHPAALRERWRVQEDGKRMGPALPPPSSLWQALGADLVLSEQPYRLAPGCWTTGTVPRRSFEKAGVIPNRFYREGDRFLPDLIEDDQALVINVAAKGLVVLAGCAHAGIVNTVRYAQEISGVQRVYAVIGGFHLVPANAEDIRQTIEEIRRLGPILVAPTHCTGLRAINQFAAQMPEAFAECVAGAIFAI